MKADLTKDELEAIRTAAIAYFESGKHEFRDTFLGELKRGALLLETRPPRIGMWTIQRRGDQITLTRQPPVSSEMHYFGLYLIKKQGHWVVTGDFHEKEQLDLQ